MNLPGDLADDDVVRRLQEVARLGMLARERAEHELGHRHVGRGFDAVARDISERQSKPAVGQFEEVVHVAPDLHARGGLVGSAELEPRQLRHRLRQQRALHRVRELLLLLVQARVVDRERGLPGDADGLVHRLRRHRRTRTHGHDRQGGNDLRGRRDGDRRPRPAATEER